MAIESRKSNPQQFPLANRPELADIGVDLPGRRGADAVPVGLREVTVGLDRERAIAGDGYPDNPVAVAVAVY